jgi:hypothetical protein
MRKNKISFRSFQVSLNKYIFIYFNIITFYISFDSKKILKILLDNSEKLAT